MNWLKLLEEMQQTAQDHQIECQWVKQSAGTSMDRNRIGQVVTNLISNALKYSTKIPSSRDSGKHDQHRN